MTSGVWSELHIALNVEKDNRYCLHFDTIEPSLCVVSAEAYQPSGGNSTSVLMTVLIPPLDSYGPR